MENPIFNEESLNRLIAKIEQVFKSKDNVRRPSDINGAVMGAVYEINLSQGDAGLMPNKDRDGNDVFNGFITVGEISLSQLSPNRQCLKAFIEQGGDVTKIIRLTKGVNGLKRLAADSHMKNGVGKVKCVFTFEVQYEGQAQPTTYGIYEWVEATA